MLGPPMFRKPEAVYLRIFCSVYAMQMQPMYDYEFFGTANPLRIEEVQVLTLFLNRLAYHFVTNMPNNSVLEPTGKALRSSLTSLVCLLYNRHCRRKILQGDTPWVIVESRSVVGAEYFVWVVCTALMFSEGLRFWWDLSTRLGSQLGNIC